MFALFKDKDKETNRIAQTGLWTMLLSLLQQFILAEKSYVEIGFLQTKNKGFLRKDVWNQFNWFAVFLQSRYFRTL